MPDKRTILIAGMGTSPAVLTETVWALCHQKKPVVPDEIVVLVTKSGKERLCAELLMGDESVWEKMLAALKKEKIKIDGKLQINDNFKYTSQLVLFSDYLDNPQNIRVNWDNRFDWKIAKYFSLTVTTNLIYDDKVMVKTEKILEKYPEGRKMVQFKESLAFGFSYTIASRKK